MEGKFQNNQYFLLEVWWRIKSTYPEKIFKSEILNWGWWALGGCYNLLPIRWRMWKKKQLMHLDCDNRVSVICHAGSCLPCNSIHLDSKYIQLPGTDGEFLNLVKHFFDSYGVPHCVGAIDETHKIKQLWCNSTDCINNKGYYSLNVQACYAHIYCFIDVVVKWPSSVLDAYIFSNSKLNLLLHSH